MEQNGIGYWIMRGAMWIHDTLIVFAIYSIAIWVASWYYPIEYSDAQYAFDAPVPKQAKTHK